MYLGILNAVKNIAHAILARPNNAYGAAQELIDQNGFEEATRLAREMQNNTEMMRALARVANAVHRARNVEVGEIEEIDVAASGHQLESRINSLRQR